MRWRGREESENVEKRGGVGGATMAVGGGGAILVVILGLIFGVDVNRLLGPAQQQNNAGPEDPLVAEYEKFSSVILRDTEIVWDDLFRRLGRQYEKPKLILFRGSVQSKCGMADKAVGPFYCPTDGDVYIDVSFYRDMERKLNAPGEFARAYVLAHEVGHHVQNLLGYNKRSQELGGGKKNSVRLELQADFLAGVWAHYAQKRFNYLEPGDLESALNAAFEIGDDRLQKKSQGYVVPDAFTHGTSAQRKRWFSRGFETGKVADAELLFRMPYEQL